MNLKRRINVKTIRDYMDSQVALNELCEYLLGKDWYVAEPLSQSQVNERIVSEIKSKYKPKL
jgi:hypothetical protein